MLLGALEAGGTKMVCAIGNEKGKIQDRISIPTTSPLETMPQIASYFEQFKLEAIGIGCFGPIDLNRSSQTYGYITTTPKLKWANYDMVGFFRKHFRIPVGFDTDVNASALGEATFGITTGLENSIYITIGTGVGVGVITNGKLLHGMLHPEAGHILLMRHPSDLSFTCNCPFHESCLEGLAAGPSVEKRWGKKGMDLAERSEVWALEAYYIGQALCDYILMLSPEKIVLGGGIMHQTQLLPLIHKEVIKQLNGYLKTEPLSHIEDYIVLPSLNDNQGIMGALQLAVMEMTR